MSDPVSYYTQNPQGQPIPVRQTGTPGVSGAIQDMIAALAKAFAPRSIVQRQQSIDQSVGQNDGSQTPKLGDEF